MPSSAPQIADNCAEHTQRPSNVRFGSSAVKLLSQYVMAVVGCISIAYGLSEATLSTTDDPITSS